MTVLRYLFFSLGLCVLVTLGWRLVHVRPAPDAGLDEPVQQAASEPPAAPPAPAPPAPVPAPAVPPAAPVAPPSSVPPAASSAATQFDEARRVVLARMQDVPQFKTFYDRMAAAYPHVQDGIVDASARRLAEAGVLGSPDTLLWDALRTLQQSQGIMASRAGQDVLTAFFNARLALLDALAPADAKLCADFLYGTTDTSIDTFSAAHHDLVAAFATTELAAITDGQAHPKDTAKPTAPDIDLVASGLAERKLTPDEIAVLIDGKTVDPPIPDARLCDIGRIYLSVLRSLPAESRQRVYGFAAELLARS